MKKTLLLSAILLISCSKEDEIVVSNSCHCDAWYKPVSGQRYVVQNVELDCETYQPIVIIPDAVFLGCDNRDIP